MPKNSKQIFITRTQGEWDFIKNKLAADGNNPLEKLSLHIRKEVLKVKNKLKEVPDEFSDIKGGNVAIRPHLPNPIIKDIQLIALQIGVTENVLIDRLIITPLLKK